MDLAYENVLDEIEDIAMDPDLDEEEKVDEVEDLLDAEGVDPQDLEASLDSDEESGDEDGFLFSPEDIDDDFED